MSTNLTIYEDWRTIPDAFMNTGNTGEDGREGDSGYIDCTLKVSGGARRGVCCGISAASTTHASGLAQIIVKGRGGNAKVTLQLVVGLIHPCNPSKLYSGDAHGVVLHY